MFNKKLHRGVKLFFVATLFFCLLLGSVGSLWADSDLRRIRVGLIEPGASLSSCTIGFEDAHGVYLPKDSKSYSFQSPLFIVNGAATYTLKRVRGNCEISTESFQSVENVDLSKYPNYVPMVSGSGAEQGGLKLINGENAFSTGEKKWTTSKVDFVDGVGFFQENKLKFVIANSYAVIKSQNDNQFLFYKSRFRGGLSIYSAFKDGVSFFPINHLDIESYLYGVVPREMPTSWNKEALKAQAVCARTYALSSIGNYKRNDYDVAPTVASQVYGGVSAENANGNEAVDSTRGEEMFYGNDRIQAFFHSSNGGFCAGSEDVFTTKLPYFRPKVDPYSLKITKPWTVSVSPDVLKRGLAKRKINIGDIVNLEIVDVNPSRLVRKVRVYGTAGNTEISGSRLSVILGVNNVKSLYFKLVPNLEQAMNETASQGTSTFKAQVLTESGTKTMNKETLTVIQGNGNVEALNTDLVLSAGGSGTIAFEETKSGGAGYEGAKPGQTGMVIVGYGWGHNLGMSQWGAKVMADEGFNYKDILGFYYEGMEIRKN